MPTVVHSRYHRGRVPSTRRRPGLTPDTERRGRRARRHGSPPTDPPTPAPPPGRLLRLVRGRPEDPTWVRPALVALLVGTGFLYLWGLGQSGWANSFYSAAVQAGTKSWKAFFFGSSDASNFITVDKPPASLWVMEISARLFGVNAWSILVPQALEGVATVGLLYATVRRWFAPGAALLAGAVLALTPVATLMFRFNNPDAMLTLRPHRGGLRHDPGHRRRTHPVDGVRRSPDRFRVHHQDAPGADPPARYWPSSTCWPVHRSSGGASCSWSTPVWPCWSRRDGGWRPSS